MIYYRHKKTGEVFAYEQSDLDAVDSIAPLEQALQDAIAALPSDEEDEGYESAKQVVDEAQAALDAINPVFFQIRDNLKHCTLMTEEEVEEHINPTPTPEQLADEARDKRDGLLHELDAIVSNPLRWAEFDEATKQALAAYRQALLDVPQQEGFPYEIDWPENPLEDNDAD
jgi:hypothetical protein